MPLVLMTPIRGTTRLRRAFLAGAAALGLGLSGCGFQPMYGVRTTSEQAEALLGSVAIAPIRNDRTGQLLRNDLIDKISGGQSAQNPRYRLDVQLETLELGGLIETDASITRYTVTFKGKLRLVDVASGQIVMNEMARATTAYSVPASEYAAITAQQDAYRRASDQLANEIRARIASFLETRRST